MTQDDRRWIAAVDEAYRPPPNSTAGREAFHERLEARLERRRALRLRALVPACAVAAAVAVWLALPGEPERPVESAPVLYAFVDPSLSAEDTGDYLPEDYQALAALLEIDAAER